MSLRLTEQQLAAGQLPAIAREAGRLIMAVRQSGDLGKETKFTYGKTSPFTKADIQAHHYLMEALGKLIPGVGVVSEESPQQDNESFVNTQPTFWLIDPLDGTSSFIAGRDNFAVNIALIHQGEPVLGAVYFPAQQ